MFMAISRMDIPPQPDMSNFYRRKTPADVTCVRASLNGNFPTHAHHLVHEMRATDRVDSGTAGRDGNVGRLAGAEFNIPILHLGHVFRCNLRSGKEFRRTEVMVLGTVIDEVHLVSHPRFQIERAGREGVIGQGDGDRGGRLRQGAADGRKQGEGEDENSSECHPEPLR
jgi:hypothetical protein